MAAAKKTPRKTVTKKTATKRNYARKPKVETAAVEVDVQEVNQVEAQAEISTEEMLRRENEDLRRGLKNAAQANVDLMESVTNPKNLHKQLEIISQQVEDRTKVYVELLHMRDNMIGRALIADVLANDGYVFAFGGSELVNTANIMTKFLLAEVLLINPINRTVAFLRSDDLPEDTLLHRIRSKEPVYPKLAVVPTRPNAQIIEVDGIKFARMS